MLLRRLLWLRRLANVISIVTLTSFRLLIVIFNIVMVSTTAIVDGIVKISGTGAVVVVVVAARTNVATAGMAAGWDRVASTTSAAAAAEIVRSRVRMVIVDGRRWGQRRWGCSEGTRTVATGLPVVIILLIQRRWVHWVADRCQIWQ